LKAAPEDSYQRGDLLDGAAMAAHRLGRKDVSRRLRRAWSEEPDIVRLRRWLGAASTRRTLRRRVREALEDCPKKALRQRGLLHVLDKDFTAAAKLA